MVIEVKFPSRLREIRKLRGLNQEELAKLVGTTKTTISNYETGYSTPPFDMLLSISIKLDVSIDYLMGRVDNPLSHKSLDIVKGLNEAIDILNKLKENNNDNKVF
ncbi:TPA: helix-turn-helix domain-containing protein [Bacillus cereus]